MQIGRKVYYDKATGNVLVNTGEREGSVMPTTSKQDIVAYKVLSERNSETFDVIELNFSEYAQDFNECNGYKVNVNTLELEFSYLTPGELQEPIYQKSLIEQFDGLKIENTSLANRIVFLEDVIMMLI